MSEDVERLKVGAIIEGMILPEPIRIVFVQEMGSYWKIGGQGLPSGGFHQLVLSLEQVR